MASVLFAAPMGKRNVFRDRRFRYKLRSLNSTFGMLSTHFTIQNSPSNNIAESVNDKVKMKLKMMRGYKRVGTARDSLKLTLTYYRFNPFSSSTKKENNWKSPLTLARVNVNNREWLPTPRRIR